MHPTTLYANLHKLVSCLELATVVSTLCEQCTSLFGASRVAVFLRDYSCENLVLSGSFPENALSCGLENLAVSVNDLEDPLCFCALNGKTCKVDIRAFNTHPMSIRLLHGGNEACLAWASFSPLVGLGGTMLGAVALAHAERPEFDATILEVICLHGGVIMEAAMQRKNHTADMYDMRMNISRLEKQTSRLPEREAACDIIGESLAIKELRRKIPAVANSSASIFIGGETGTGKGLLARNIHHSSLRAHSPFVEINCAALPENLLESELFGHVKGAFSGADSDHIGLLRSAQGGTVFLDEIGSLPLLLQGTLLHVLQEKKVRPVGGVRDYSVDMRIISATNDDLNLAMAEGRFRSDLYHRLAVVTLHMPPLSERVADIPILAKWFLEIFKKEYKLPDLQFSPPALRAITQHNYPGNVRELAAVIERAVMFAEPGTTSLPPELFTDAKLDSADLKGALSLDEYLEERERSLIKSYLHLYEGNVRHCAEALAVPRRTLHRKIVKYGLNDLSVMSTKEI